MSLVLTQEGASTLWKWVLGITPLNTPNCHLFGEAFTPQHIDTEATFAAYELPRAAGYAPIALATPAEDWTISPISQGAQAVYYPLLWMLTAQVTIYGYWLSDFSNTYSLWAEEFEDPFPLPFGGGYFSLILPPQMVSLP